MIKILFLTASPIDQARLRLDEEVRTIDAALRSTQDRSFAISSHWAVRVDDLQPLLLRHRPDIVHFSGHGEPGGIVLQDEKGYSQLVDVSALANLFRLLKDKIRCVVLNACYSEIQAEAIAEVVDCVIGSSDVILDDAARTFSVAFYRALGHGRSIAEAFELGCNQLELSKFEDKQLRLLAKRLEPATVYFDSTYSSHAETFSNYLHYLYQQLVRPRTSDNHTTSNAVYIAPFVRESSPLSGHNHQLSVSKHEQLPQTISVIEQINRYPRLVLLGDRGSGKSSTIDFICFCMAGEWLGKDDANISALRSSIVDHNLAAQNRSETVWEHGALLPIRIELGDWAASHLFGDGERGNLSHLWRYICEELEKMALSHYITPLQSYLDEQGILILFDGCEKVSETGNRRLQVKQAIESFAQRFSKCRMLLATYPHLYKNPEWQLKDFVLSGLLPFAQSQIQLYVARWYAQSPLPSLRSKEKARYANRLRDAICNTPGLLELATRPHFLAHIVANYAEHPEQLRQDRAKLYKFAIDFLLSPHYHRDPIAGMDHLLTAKRDSLLATLAEIAFAAHLVAQDSATVIEINKEKLRSIIWDFVEELKSSDNKFSNLSGQQIVDYLLYEAGILVAQSKDGYRFIYHAFQEFFTAYHVEEMVDSPYEIARLARATSNHWHEIMLLSALSKKDPYKIWAIADQLRESEVQEESAEARAKAILLAAEVVVECFAPDKYKRQPFKVRTLRKELHDVLEGTILSTRERTNAGRALNRLGDDRPYANSISGLELCYVPSGDFYLDDNHLATVPYGYWIGRFPVTQAQYAEFDGYTSSEFWQEAREKGIWSYEGVRERSNNQYRNLPLQFDEQLNLQNHPVTGISWYEATAFCRWVCKRYFPQVNRGVQQPKWKVRLPTHREWVKAAMGGTNIPSQPIISRIADILMIGQEQIQLKTNPQPKRHFPWGDAADHNLANSRESRMGNVTPIGCFHAGASPYGVEELVGNVREWGHPIDDYDRAPVLGGSYVDEAWELTNHSLEDANGANPGCGFRFVIIGTASN